MKRLGQMAAAPGGRHGKGLKAWTLEMRRFCRRSGRRQDCFGQRTPTSRQGKLERKRVAAGVDRKDHMRRGAERNLNYRLDFGAREPLRANALFAPGELPRCGWRCLLRRRTSLRVKNRTDAARWGKYSAELSWSSTVGAARWRDASEWEAKARTGSEPECAALQGSAARPRVVILRDLDVAMNELAADGSRRR
jgi:hypothetical protein